MNLVRLRVFIRSLFLQSAWNFERMQNVGFTFALAPFIRQLYKDDRRRIGQRLKDHFGFFNTHPYLANLLLGIVMGLEERHARGEIRSEEILRTRAMLAGPVAAIGDRLIWSTWRVFCSILGIAVFMAGGREGFWFSPGITAVCVTFLLVYNAGNLPLRYAALRWGYDHSGGVIQQLSTFELQRWVLRIRTAGRCVLLMAAAVYSVTFESVVLTVVFWLFVVGAFTLKRRFRAMQVFYLLYAAIMLVVYGFTLGKTG